MAEFIKVFFAATPEAVARSPGAPGPTVRWFLPLVLRPLLVETSLGEQLADIGEWFSCVFVGANCAVSGWQGEEVADMASFTSTTDDIAAMYRAAATTWAADWVAIRRPGSVLPRGWLTVAEASLRGTAHAAAAMADGGFLILMPNFHAHLLDDQALVPPTLSPSASWYAWLRQVYVPPVLAVLGERERAREIERGEESPDADAILLLPDDAYVAEGDRVAARAAKLYAGLRLSQTS